MNLDEFDFQLPASAIALRPAAPRDHARLLIVRPGAERALSEARILDLPSFLRRGDVMVFNDTKVLPAELAGSRPSREQGGAKVPVSLTLVERLADGNWKALARPSRRLREGDGILLERGPVAARIYVAAKGDDGEVTIRASAGTTIEAVMAAHGAAPLPPYIARCRAADERDRRDYQTVYATREGAVAAPTAGLHFTPGLLARLQARGVTCLFVTLHVGAGTFLPVKTGNVEGHRLHPEWCEIAEVAARTINDCRAKGGRLVAVGTTSLRLLETAACEDGSIAPYAGPTDIFIKPGHRFRSADLLLTNFHLPKSTLFMLVCAFSGTALMKAAYAHALASGFRFYSYGDACLLHRSVESPPP